MSESKELVYFSLLSGDVYTITEDEVENLDTFQVPLLKAPKGSCKKCYGRGYIGYDPLRKYYVMCKCILKRIDRDRVKAINLKY